MYRHVVLLLFVLACIRVGQTKYIFKKSYCEVTDKAARFNFTRLSESTDDRVLVDEKFGENIRLRLCDALHKPCNGLNHYSICLSKDNVETGIGKAPPDSVVANSGQLRFLFTGENCEDDRNYSVQITMKCNNEAGYDSQPELFPRESDRCSFHMVWESKAACSQEHIVECKAVDKENQHYDLSSLTLRSENYVIHHVPPVYHNINDSVMILNVCHSLIYDYGATCHEKAGACLREFDKKKNEIVYTNLGSVANPPYFDNGILTLKYVSGKICVNNKDRSHVDTIILFECDHRAMNTRPEYEGGAENCLHKFRWKTAAACSVESLKSLSATPAETCKVTNPLTKIEYNFQELMSKDFRSKSPNGTIYTFQICGRVSDSSCPTGAGACDVKNKISAGLSNSNLMWSQGGPYLNYTDGVECGNNQRRYTQIAFFCGAEGSPRTPIVIQDKNCALIIHWNTPLVCDKRIKCETKGGEMSLTSLIRWSDNYVVKAKDTEFYINVCRSLVSKPYLTCLHGSAVCRMVPEASGQPVNETSLGYPDENPFIDEENHVVLRYTGGSACTEDKRIKLSSNLTFLCNYSAAVGAPRYKYYKNCTHAFEWATSVVCEKTEGRWAPGCIIENPHLSQLINLTKLGEKPVYSVKSLSGDRYNVSLCGGNAYCNGSVVCKGDKGYGSSSTVVFDYPQNAIIAKFSHGSPCKTGFYSSELRFICDESAGNGEPKLIEIQSSETSCSVAFEWRTNVVCVNQSMATVSITSETKPKETVGNVEESTTTHVGKYIGIGILVSCCIALIIYLWSSGRCTRLRNCFDSLTTRRERCRAHYTKVNATEEARLLLDIGETTQCQNDSDSDDELLDA